MKRAAMPEARSRAERRRTARERARAPEREGDGADSPSPRRWRVALLAALFLAATLVVYARGVGAPFVFDDLRNIVHNPLVRDLSWFARPWAVDDSGAHYFHLHTFKTRFVTYLTFALNYRFGRLDVAGYHLTSLACHLACALLVGLGWRRALGSPALAASALAPERDTVAVVAAGLFALHPIQTEAVTYTVQRAAVLAALFAVASFCCYLRALDATGGARLGWAAGALGALVAASLSKQNAVIFPLVLVIYDLLFVPRSRRARLAWLVVPAAAILVVPLQQLYLVVRSLGWESLLARSTALPGAVSRLEYLATQTRVVTRYVGLLLFPVGQTLEHDVAWSRSFAEPAVLVCTAFLAAFAVLALRLARARAGRDPAWRLVGFGLLWFLICLAVESSVIPIPDAMLEHRLYLPSVGFFGAAATAAALAGSRARLRIRLGALAAATLVLAACTYRRNAVWADERLFWDDLLAKSPNKARVLYNVGYYELQRGNGVRARELLQRAVARDPGYAAAWIWLGHLARQEGDFAGAAAAYRRAMAADPANWATLVDLRVVLLRQGETAEADRLWSETTRLAGSEAAVVELLRRSNAAWAIPARDETKTP